MLAAHLAKVCLRHLLPLFIKETAGEITSLAQNRDFVYFSKIPLSPCKSNANWNLKTKYSDCLVFLSRQRTREGMVHYQSQVRTLGLSQDLWTNFRARGKEFENMQDIAKKFSKQRGRRDWRTFFSGKWPNLLHSVRASGQFASNLNKIYKVPGKAGWSRRTNVASQLEYFEYFLWICKYFSERLKRMTLTFL